MPSFTPPFPIIVEIWPIVHKNFFTFLDVPTYKSPKCVRPVSFLINARTSVNAEPLVTVHNLGYQDMGSDANRTCGKYEFTFHRTVRPCYIVIDDSRFVSEFGGVNVMFVVQTEIIIAPEVT